MRRAPRSTRPLTLVASVTAGILLGGLGLAACKIPNETGAMKKALSQHGSIDAEWQVRDEEEGKTYTYVFLRNKSGTHETYQITATDGQRNVTRKLLGGIDANGCYLRPVAHSTQWILQLPSEALEDATERGEQTRTACLEYRDSDAWIFVPEEERKAAEPPPPPPPEPTAAPDAGMPDAGSSPDAGPSTPTEPMESDSPAADSIEDALGL